MGNYIKKETMTVRLLRVPKIPFKAPAGLLRLWQSVFALFYCLRYGFVQH